MRGATGATVAGVSTMVPPFRPCRPAAGLPQFSVAELPGRRRHTTRIADLALKHGLPTLYFSDELPRAGALLSYGVSIVAIYRRAAYYVDRILKGTNPADLPVEQPAKFELVINLKTSN